MPVAADLAKAPKWAAMCKEADCTTFAWAHDGQRKNGWVELKENGQLLTGWCEGTWKVVDSDPDVIDMTFGSSKHLCRFKEGGFVVEEKFLQKTMKPSYKPDQPRTCGWIKPGLAPGQCPGMKFPGRPRRRATEKEDSDDDAPRVASFQQKDLKFDAFFSEWSESKRRRLAAKTPPLGAAAPPAVPAAPAA